MLIAVFFVSLSACNLNSRTETPKKEENLKIAGTWKLLSGTLIEKGDTAITDYTQGRSFIKIINSTHFAFLQHDLQKGKDSTASFSAGGGTYTIKGNAYTEHLEYCNARDWEGHDFTFTLTLTGDTLVQQGIEKIEGTAVNRLNIEKYIRVKQ